MAFDYAIALTGSIATGKSTVAEIFKDFGFVVIDADTIAHQMLDRYVQKVHALFGDAVIENQKVNRKALGAIVFNDIKKRKALENLLHPLIYTEIEKQSEQEERKKKPYFVDIPLFFETQRYPIKKIFLVYTSKELQLQRLMQRNPLTKEEAWARIELQIDIELKRKKSTYIIENVGDMEHLQQECAKIKEVILGDFQ